MEQLNDENYGLIDSEHLLSIKMTAFLYYQDTRRNREGGSFFVAAPDDRGEMTFGEVSGGESRARRTLRRSRKPCQEHQWIVRVRTKK